MIERDTFCIWNFDAKLSKWTCFRKYCRKICTSNSKRNWDFLDEFEGAEFERFPVTVERFDEFEVETFIYVLKASVEELKEDIL